MFIIIIIIVLITKILLHFAQKFDLDFGRSKIYFCQSFAKLSSFFRASPNFRAFSCARDGTGQNLSFNSDNLPQSKCYYAFSKTTDTLRKGNISF